MSRVQIPMPQMGESITEGTVSVWLKGIGDRVDRDEPIMEIATDKVDAEIPSPAAGVLTEILVQEGETVEVGTIVGYVDTDGADPAGAVSAPEPHPAEVSTATSGTEEAGRASEGDSSALPPPDTTSASAPGPPPPDTAGPSPARVSAAAPDEGDESEEERLRRHSTPLVRRIAAEHGVELDEITGTGRNGRVTKADVLKYVQERDAPTETGGRRAPPPQRRAPEPATGGIAWDEFYSHVDHPEIEVGPRDQVEPMSRMTSLIAEHMILSQRISAHVHSYFEIDYSRIDQLRERNRTVWAEQGIKVTYTAFIARAVAQALREHPRLNAAVSGRNVVYRGEINVGFAVALDWGLIVPVVRNADELSLLGLARTLADLANRARAKRLAPEEVRGGTFTITNPGIFGTVLGFPIVNQPQVAIMGVGAVEKRPVIISDEFGNDAVVARKRGFLSLGYDHRLVNGADADRFLARVKELLESATELAP